MHSDAVNAIQCDTLDGPTKRFVEKLRNGYKRDGAGLSDEDKVRCVAMREELSTYVKLFEDNVINNPRFIEIDPEQLVGLPQDYKDAHPPAVNGKVNITTAYPDYMPFATFAKSDEARRLLHVAFCNVGMPANASVLKRMLELRQSIAKLLGFPTWAACEIAHKSIKTDVAAETFAIETADAVQGSASAISDRLLEVLQKDQPDIKELTGWRVKYANNLLVKQVLGGFDENALRPYLRSSQVKKGIFSLFEHNFKIKLEKVEGAPTWHEDVEVFSAVDMANGGGPMGEIYLDLHPRDGKYSHACCCDITRGIPGLQPPRCALICNFPREEGGKDALYTFLDASTFLREIFHGVHVLCAQSPWYKLSSFTCEVDFVEVPSLVIENWMFDKGFLGTFATDASGKLIPNEYVDALKVRDELERALFVRRQMSFSLVSLKLHQLPLDENGGLMTDPEDVFEECVRILQDLPIVQGTHFLNKFTHLREYNS